ncbi:MAG TPA: LamB/YcsF family protein, partial [Verrucomicrobiae bacterium]|nr:LamB/YcsF family protein [Verrucomicrobiae bacterium]
MKLDLNCDLGEGEPLGRTRALMRWISSANVACGGHAGDVRSMRACVRLAKQSGVKLGAHPGPWSRTDRGR